MNLAKKTKGRIISYRAEIQLRPKDWAGKVGETDAADEIGNGLIIEALKVLKMACEAEGFEVIIKGTGYSY